MTKSYKKNVRIWEEYWVTQLGNFPMFATSYRPNPLFDWAEYPFGQTKTYKEARETMENETIKNPQYLCRITLGILILSLWQEGRCVYENRRILDLLPKSILE